MKLNRIEIDAFEELQVAMDTKVRFSTNLKAIKSAVEKLCKSYYIRRFNDESKLDSTSFVLIKDLHKRGVFDDFLADKLHTLRKYSNLSTHTSKMYTKNYVDSSRYDLLFFFTWYQNNTKIKFPSLWKFHFGISGKTGAIAKKMKDSGHYQEKDLNIIFKDKELDHYEVQQKEFNGIPTYGLLLIDVSISMDEFIEEVIDSQNQTLEILRESAKCKKERLYVMQSLFNQKSHIINPLTPLSRDKKDNVKYLSKSNYSPSGCTALFDCLCRGIFQIQKEIDYTEGKGRVPDISICVITDGQDTCSQKYEPEDVKKQLDYLRKRLKANFQSLLIGWTEDKGFTMSNLESLKNEMGFDEAIAFDLSKPSAIRAAFNLWSKRLA